MREDVQVIYDDVVAAVRTVRRNRRLAFVATRDEAASIGEEIAFGGGRALIYVRPVTMLERDRSPRDYDRRRFWVVAELRDPHGQLASVYEALNARTLASLVAGYYGEFGDVGEPDSPLQDAVDDADDHEKLYRSDRSNEGR